MGQEEEKKEEIKEKEKEEKEEKEEKKEEEEEKKFLRMERTDGRTDQSKVVQEVLADLKIKDKEMLKNYITRKLTHSCLTCIACFTCISCIHCVTCGT